jgi:hypothetical protein
MGVEYRLPHCLTAIHSNVKSLRVELVLKYAPNLSDESKGVRVFLSCHLP